MSASLIQLTPSKSYWTSSDLATIATLFPYRASSVPKQEQMGRSVVRLPYVRYEGFCREHMLDAMESCEDILETYREYIVALKKWARLGTPRHLQHFRPLHARILEELVGGMSQKPGRSPVKWDSF